MKIIQTVAQEREGIGLADLAKSVELHSSTTFHLAKTLTILGLLRQDQETKRYRVGPQLFGLAAGAFDEIELLNVAHAFMASLASATGESSHLAVSAGDSVVIIGKVDGAGSIRMTERVGTARPAHATAIGKVILSGMPEAKLEALLARTPLERVTDKTIVERDALLRQIEAARKDGIAFDDGEYDPEVRCLAAPVFDFRQRLVAAIGITAPVWRLGLQRVGEASEIVREAARELSTQLGHNPPAAEARSR